MVYFCLFFVFFFFKQKTAYEMRISDWSSDVCSSDLVIGPPVKLILRIFLCRTIASPHSALPGRIDSTPSGTPASLHNCANSSGAKGVISAGLQIKIGRASCRERVCQYV